MSSVHSLDKQFAGLFDGQTQEDGDDGLSSRDNNGKFMLRFGWIYQAAIIAEHERIKLEEVYNLPTIQCLNALSYLKAKNAFEVNEIKRINGK